jgi:hypothetical protein
MSGFPGGDVGSAQPHMHGKTHKLGFDLVQLYSETASMHGKTTKHSI